MLKEVVEKANSAIGLYSSLDIHRKEAKCSVERHDQALKVDHKLHEKSLKISKQTYLMAAFSSLEKHFQQLTADLINSSRESENDMFDQRNQSFQTIILSASVMFSSLATVIIQGFLPDHADTFLYVAYAFTCSFSFLFLFLSIVLCIEVILRASSFMYKRANQHTLQLKESIKKAKEMMDEIRSGSHEVDASITEPENTQHNTAAGGGAGGSGGGAIKHSRRNIADLDGAALKEEWETHEEKVHQFLQERERINENAHMFGTSFEDFYKRHCKLWGDLAIFSFYAGTSFLLLAIMVYMWGEFDVTYDSLVGAVIAVVFIGVALVWGLSLAISMRVTDKMGKMKAAARAAGIDDEGEDERYMGGSEVSGSEWNANNGRLSPSRRSERSESRSRAGSLLSGDADRGSTFGQGRGRRSGSASVATGSISGPSTAGNEARGKTTGLAAIFGRDGVLGSLTRSGSFGRSAGVGEGVEMRSSAAAQSALSARDIARLSRMRSLEVDSNMGSGGSTTGTATSRNTSNQPT